MKPFKVKKELKQSVGIIGAGPAGMACAEELRKSGYQVTIYDRYDRPGGLLIYGIPNFKLEKFVVERRTKLLKESGINFVQNFEVGKDKTLYELREKHDAILIATGVYKAREIDILVMIQKYFSCYGVFNCFQQKRIRRQGKII